MSVDLHQLIAPYALDALEADDRSRFEAHLALCEQCRVELVGFMSTAARLGEAEAVTPPPELRERLLTMAESTSQEHPVVTALSQRRRASAASLPGSRSRPPSRRPSWASAASSPSTSEPTTCARTVRTSPR